MQTTAFRRSSSGSNSNSNTRSIRNTRNTRNNIRNIRNLGGVSNRPARNNLMARRGRRRNSVRAALRNRTLSIDTQGRVLGSGKFGSVYRLPEGLVSRLAGHIAVKRILLRSSTNQVNGRYLPRPNAPANNDSNFHYRTHKPNVELLMLMLMSQHAETGKFPNFPLLYGIAFEGNRAALVATERADSDLADWLKTALGDSRALVSAAVQCVLALAAFRYLGFAHNDAHAKNFLRHAVPPGGYWKYEVGASVLYVRNTGSQFVLWDPMMASQARGGGMGDDRDLRRIVLSILQWVHYDRNLMRVLEPLAQDVKGRSFRDALGEWLRHLKALPSDFLHQVDLGIVSKLSTSSPPALNPTPYTFPRAQRQLFSGNGKAAFDDLLQHYRL